MKVDTHRRDDKRSQVVMEESELLKFCDSYPPTSKKWIAINLLCRSGIKVLELLKVRREDVDVSDDPVLKVRGSGTTPSLRLTPLPTDVAYAILGRDEGELFDKSDRSVRRWINKKTEEYAEKYDDNDWLEISAIDIRRSWIVVLLENGVPPYTVKTWAGIESFRQFQERYMDRVEATLIAEERNRTELF